MSEKEKDEVVKKIVAEGLNFLCTFYLSHSVRVQLLVFYDTDPSLLLRDNPRHFFELKSHLEKMLATINWLPLHTNLLQTMRFASKQKQMLLSVTDFSSQH